MTMISCGKSKHHKELPVPTCGDLIPHAGGVSEGKPPCMPGVAADRSTGISNRNDVAQAAGSENDSFILENPKLNFHS